MTKWLKKCNEVNLRGCFSWLEGGSKTTWSISKKPLNSLKIYLTHPPFVGVGKVRRKLDVFVARGDTNVVRPVPPTRQGAGFLKGHGKAESGFAIGARHKWKSLMQSSIVLGSILFSLKGFCLKFSKVIFYFVISFDKMGRLGWGYIMVRSLLQVHQHSRGKILDRDERKSIAWFYRVVSISEMKHGFFQWERLHRKWGIFFFWGGLISIHVENPIFPIWNYISNSLKMKFPLSQNLMCRTRCWKSGACAEFSWPNSKL